MAILARGRTSLLLRPHLHVQVEAARAASNTVEKHFESSGSMEGVAQYARLNFQLWAAQNVWLDLGDSRLGLYLIFLADRPEYEMRIAKHFRKLTRQPLLRGESIVNRKSAQERFYPFGFSLGEIAGVSRSEE